MKEDPDEPKRSLTSKVERWLDKGSIPVEYRVADALARHDLEVEQGRSYAAKDPDDRTVYREIDVVGWAIDTRSEMAVVVECKQTGDKPWVVLTNRDHLTATATVSQSVSGQRAQKAIRSDLGRYRPGLSPLFIDYPHPGFSVVVADDLSDKPRDEGRRGADDRELARAAMAQVIGAARGLLGDDPRWSLAWPVVVITGPLFEVRYEHGAALVLPATWKRVSWWSSPYGGAVVLDIVTEEHFVTDYARPLAEGLSRVNTLLMTEHDKDREDGSPGTV